MICRQAPAELTLVREFCRLSERETAVVASPPKGSALWRVGNRSFQVEHVLSAREREITWTDERMVGQPLGAARVAESSYVTSERVQRSAAGSGHLSRRVETLEKHQFA